jgi:hypothetical protein
MELLYSRYNDSGIGYLFRILLAVVILFAVYALIKGALKRINNIQSHGHRLFEHFPCSPQELYEVIEQEVLQREIDGVSLKSVYYAEGGVFSPNREYLRISFGKYVFDICAAPFAKQLFVSWWQGVLSDPIRDFLLNLPFIGKIFRERQKTFFELDQEIMFKETVSKILSKVIGEVSEAKGVRITDELNWNLYNRPY